MSAITRALAITPLVLSLAGCAIGSFEAPTATSTPQAITGSIHGGQQPIGGSTITMWAAGTSGYGTGATVLGTTTSTAAGNFNFPGYTCPYANTPLYITAQGGNAGSGINPNIMLVAGLGPCSGITTSSFVNIDEVTTAATVYALTQFISTAQGSGQTDAIGGLVTSADGPAGTYNTGLVIADQYTVPALVNLGNGQAVTTHTSGALTTTLESAKLNTLANIIATCINTGGETSTTEITTPCGQLFNLTQPKGSTTRPYDTFQAALQIARFPYINVTPLFNLSTANPPFVGLSSAPNDWTLAISYTSSAFGLGINGYTNSRSSTNIDIDAAGNVWFPSNSTSSHGLGEFSPSTGSFSGPYLTGLTHPQYLAITQQGLVYGSDNLASQIGYIPAASPTTSGTLIQTSGFTGPIVAESSTAFANAGSPEPAPATDNIIFTGNGAASQPGSMIYRYNSSGVNQISKFNNPVDALVSFFQSAGSFDAATSGFSTACYEEDDFGNSTQATVETGVSVNSGACFSGGIASTIVGNDFIATATTANELCDYGNGSPACFTAPVALTAPIGIATDGAGAIWVANAGNSSVSTFGNANKVGNQTDYFQTSTIPYIHDTNNGSTIKNPWGLAIDRSGNVWLSNAGCVATNGAACAPGAFTLSQLVGAAAPTLTPLADGNLNATQGFEPQAISSNPIAEGKSVTRPAAIGRNTKIRK